jgi:hypothetical protein
MIGKLGLSGALRLPRVNLLIADDVGAGERRLSQFATDGVAVKIGWVDSE